MLEFLLPKATRAQREALAELDAFLKDLVTSKAFIASVQLADERNHFVRCRREERAPDGRLIAAATIDVSLYFEGTGNGRTLARFSGVKANCVILGAEPSADVRTYAEATILPAGVATIRKSVETFLRKVTDA